MTTEIKTGIKMDQTIFGKQGENPYGFGDHNVHEIFPAGSPELIEYLEQHYGQRCGHLPDTEQVGVFVGNANPIVHAQMDYYSSLLGAPIKVEERRSLNGQYKGALVVPYINTSAAERRFQSHGLEIWGLPGKIVDNLKNKATCHRLIREMGIPGFSVPDHRIIDVDNISVETVTYLQQIQADYARTNTQGYPVGVMMRAAESDGNYGACYLKETPTGVNLVPNGDSKEVVQHKDWRSALQNAQNYLLSTASANKGVEPRIVVSRLMDLADSPGMSALIVNGEILPLRWNGQVRESAESSACVGTSTYQSPTENLRRIQEDYEESSALAFANFIRSVIKKYGYNPKDVSGFVNVDLMIPSEMEVKFQRKLQGNPNLSSGDLITVAEINPRFTNYTDALLLVAGISGLEKTPRNILKIIQNGVYTYDKYPIKDGTKVDEVEDKIRKLDSDLQYFGTRIVLRMRDRSIGLVFAGDVPEARRRFDALGLSPNYA